MEAARRQTRWCIALLVAASLAVYANSFGGVFLYDDLVHIVGNQRIRSIGWHLWGARPLVDLTLAINYRLGGLDTWGYHAVNVTVHLLAALTLFGLVRRTLQLERYRQALGARADLVALSVALLWMVHPLQTESVTYLIQRGEAMAGLFYLLVLYCMVRAEESLRPARWLGAAVAACAAGMCAKPVLVTAPVVALLFDLLILGRGAGAIIRRRWGLYAGLLAMMVLLPATGTIGYIFASEPSGHRTAGFSYPLISPLDYALTQPGVILHYLSLVVWPRPLCLFDDWPVAETAGDVSVPMALIGLLLAGSVASWRRRPWLAFLGLAFLAILAPTSSVVPFAHPSVEHRMYLPLAAVVAAAVLGAAALLDLLCRRVPVEPRLASRAGRAIVALAAALLSLGTIDRNADYRDVVAMWRQVAAARPASSDARGQLALVLAERGDRDGAEVQYLESLRLNPANCRVREGYVRMVLVPAQRWPEAVSHGAAAVESCPSYGPAHSTLGSALVQSGDHGAGLRELREAAGIIPADPWARLNLGRGLLLAAGLDESGGPIDRSLVDEAVGQLVAAMRLAPWLEQPRRCLAEALMAQGDIDSAAARYAQAGHAVATAQPLAWLLAGVRHEREGRALEAVRCFRRATELAPGDPVARQALREARAAAASASAD